MSEIYLIGWWKSLKDSNTIYEDLMSATKKKNPNMVFIPTGRYDEERYIWYVEKYFTEKGCNVSSLKLIKDKQSEWDIIQCIESADIIYVWWWDTRKLIEVRTKRNLHSSLLEWRKNNKFILSWLSAGSICRCEEGNSRYKDVKSWKDSYHVIQWLWRLPIIHCPHYNDIERKRARPEFVKKSWRVGIAIEDYCCLIIDHNRYRTIRDKENANAYKCYRKDWRYIEEIISSGDVESLFKKNTISKNRW